MNYLIRHIIEQLEEVHHGKLWIGSTFDSKLNQVDETLVFLRPIENLHSIAEIISHLTFWRQETNLKIRTGIGSKTDDSEGNWLDNDQLQTVGWAHIKSAYDKSLVELIDLLKSKDDAFLSQTYYDPDFKGHYEYKFVINGMLHHDIYHLGQLGIILKYLKKNGK